MLGNGPVVVVFAHAGQASTPLTNAIPSVTRWVGVLREMFRDQFVGAVVMEAERPALRPGWRWPPHADGASRTR